MEDGQTSLHAKKNVGGRPTERGESKRAPISMRTTPAIRAALEEAAERGGRSLAQEIEQRLERSVAADEGAGSVATAAFLASITADIGAIEAATGQGWTVDLRTFGAVRYAIAEAIADRMPAPVEYAARLRAAIAEQRGVTAAAGFAADLVSGRLPPSLFSPAVFDELKTTYPAQLDAMIAQADQESSELVAELEREADRGREVFQEILDQRDQIARLRKRT
ncbi:hypothetical protein [Sphingomonas sp. PP-CC-3G-468]|uniref:hypothetical protein n=1 Tax=Sphingomonas sp. PP-CC-3G-468 TaxID=2135656 RepID=UPI0010F03C4E|nr:hypothetical protein [Sphingomonas sp. PP-CC-3G-468]TCM10335.1 hypothetical protein C8J41_101850 [Sphingomonas sp. PP-CC-3G-468]